MRWLLRDWRVSSVGTDKSQIVPGTWVHTWVGRVAERLQDLPSDASPPTGEKGRDLDLPAVQAEATASRDRHLPIAQNSARAPSTHAPSPPLPSQSQPGGIHDDLHDLLAARPGMIEPPHGHRVEALLQERRRRRDAPRRVVGQEFGQQGGDAGGGAGLDLARDLRRDRIRRRHRQQHARGLRRLLDEGEKGVDRAAKPLLRIGVLARDRLAPGQQAVADGLEHREEQRLLRREMIVEHRLGDRRARRDGVHRRAVIAVAGEGGDGRRDDPGPARFGAQTLFYP